MNPDDNQSEDSTTISDASGDEEILPTHPPIVAQPYMSAAQRMTNLDAKHNSKSSVIVYKESYTLI